MSRRGGTSRRGVLRVAGLLAPSVPPGRVRDALAARGVVVGDRDVPLRGGRRALVATTGAGTVVTLEERGRVLAPRIVVLRRLARLWEDLAQELDDPAQSPA